MASNGRKYIPLFVDDAVHREIIVYATETGQTMQDVVKPAFDDCLQSILKIVAQIKEMKKQAYLKALKEEEERKLVEENPMPVSGHVEDPIGNIELEQPIQTS